MTMHTHNYSSNHVFLPTSYHQIHKFSPGHEKSDGMRCVPIFTAKVCYVFLKGNVSDQMPYFTKLYKFDKMPYLTKLYKLGLKCVSNQKFLKLGGGQKNVRKWKI